MAFVCYNLSGVLSNTNKMLRTVCKKYELTHELHESVASSADHGYKAR